MSRVELQSVDVKPEKLLHEILVACLEYEPTFSLFNRELTYQDAFSGEISRIVSPPHPPPPPQRKKKKKKKTEREKKCQKKESSFASILKPN